MSTTASDLAHRIANLSPDKRRVLELQLQARLGVDPPAPVIARRTSTEPAPLSYGQQRLWFLDQLQPGLTAYNSVSAFRLRGALSQSALQQSLDEIVRRHESMRTTFTICDGQPWQMVRQAAQFPLTVEDLRGVPAERLEAEIEQRVVAEENHPFDLAQDVMRRALLLWTGDQEHVLILNGHHIASDAWSSGVFWRELTALYAAFVTDKPAVLPPLPIQYADYAQWQRQWLQSDQAHAQLTYWRNQLAGAPQMLNLPTDRPRPLVQSFRGAEQSAMLPRTLLDALKGLGRSADATLFMTLLTGFKILLYRITGQDDLVVGAPTAGRVLPELEGLIGFFVNNLVLRTQITATLTVCEALSRVRSSALNAYANQEMPFEMVLDALQPERSLSHMPFFQAMFSLQNTPRRDYHLSDLIVEQLPSESHSAKFDLAISLIEQDDGLRCTVEYSTDLFDLATIARMIGHFQVLLEGIVADPDQTIGHLPLLTLAEQHQILGEWNQTNSPYPRDVSIQQLFYSQAARSPESVAVIYGDQQFTYRELNHRSNQLARYLIRLGVHPGDRVGVLIDKSVDLVIALLAVLKAGSAYVPLNPTYPHERLLTMTSDAGVSVILTHVVDTRWLSATTVVVRVDQEQDQIAAEREDNLEIQGTGDSLAYVMYTSGTTGQPKGIAIPHRAVVRLVKETNYIEITPSDVIAQASTPSFDAATFEIWGALLNGAQLVGIDTPTLLSAVDLDNTLRKRGVTILFVTTALFNQLAAQRPAVFQSLRCLLFGGQAVAPHWVREVCLHGPPRELYHVYGPTESTTFASFQRVEQAPIEGATVPIGRPISNTQIFILDPYLNPVPVGTIGELHIGGDGLASGYLNQPALTAERFIPHPFQSGERLYRTGDLARYRPDGAIEFVGRRDRQVKIRGYRVELEEVESALRRHDALSDAVVLEQRQGEEQRLVAYLVAGAGDRPTVEQLRSALATQLPAYMLPAAYVFVDRIPLTVNGKTDVHALLAGQGQTMGFQSARTAGRDALELQLVRVWEEVLDVCPIGVHDSFFDLGGHSLLAVRLFHRIEQVFGVRLPLALLFSNQTVAELARHLEQPDSAHEWRTLISIQPNGTRPPFFCVHGFGGGVLGYADLARLLGSDQPFYGLQAAGLDGDESPDLTVEAMATRYIAAMRSVQPRGPYRVGGYCFGGVVAFEMARQLELQGDAVALLAVMEGYAPGIQRTRAALFDAQRVITIWRSLPFWLEDYWRLGAHGVNLRVQRKVRLWRKRLAPHGQSTPHIELRDVLPDDLSVVPDHQRRLMEIHLAAMRNYRPQPYGGMVTLFSARGRTISNALSGSLDPQRGWGALALGGVTVHTVEGGHRNIHLPPYVASLAAALAACL